MKKSKKALSLREILVYSFGLAGVQLLIGYMNSYQAQFYKATMGADLTIIGFVLLAAKVISALVDPFIGGLIDRSRFKSGKLRPFILIGTGLYSIFSLLIFIAVPLQGFLMYAYIFVLFLLWSISMSVTDISTQGMLSVMSPDNDDRNKIAGIANIIKGGGLVGCFVIIPAVCLLLKTGDNPMGQKEYFIGTVLMVILSAILISLIFPNVKERVPYTNSSISTKEMFRMVKSNKPLMLVFLSQLLGFGRGMSSMIQVQAAAVLIGTVSLGKIMITGENAGLIIGFSGVFTGMISGIIVPFINKKWGEKKTFVVFAVYGFITCLAAFILYVCGVTSIIAIIISLAVCGLMYGPHTFMPLVMIPDCIDNYELENGKRTDGVHYAVLSLANKLSTALSVAVGLAIVGLSGYTPGGEITIHMKNIIYFGYVMVPGISCITAMIPIIWYPLVGKEKKRIADMLAMKRKSVKNYEITE